MSLNREIRENVKNILLQKQHEKQLLAEQKLNELLKNNEFNKAYYENRELEFEIAKLEFSGKDVKSLKQKLNNNKKIINNILKDNGITIDDIVVKNQNITTQNVVYHKDYKKLYNKELLEISGVNINNLATFEKSNFNLFDENLREGMKSLYSKMQEYSSNLHKSSKKIITISGATGVGKTFLAECITTNAIKNSVYTYFTTSIALSSDLLKFHLAHISEKSSIINKYLEPELLVLDDLGVEPTYNNVTEEYIYLIIQDRLSKGKNTVITTNLNLDQIREVYGERIFSRIVNQNTALLLNLTGKDLRLGIKE